VPTTDELRRFGANDPRTTEIARSLAGSFVATCKAQANVSGRHCLVSHVTRCPVTRRTKRFKPNPTNLLWASSPSQRLEREVNSVTHCSRFQVVLDETLFGEPVPDSLDRFYAKGRGRPNQSGPLDVDVAGPFTFRSVAILSPFSLTFDTMPRFPNFSTMSAAERFQCPAQALF